MGCLILRLAGLSPLPRANFPSVSPLLVPFGLILNEEILGIVPRANNCLPFFGPLTDLPSPAARILLLTFPRVWVFFLFQKKEIAPEPASSVKQDFIAKKRVLFSLPSIAASGTSLAL